MPQIEPPPNWEKDELSQFLQHAHNNQLVTAACKTDAYNRLAKIDALFVKVCTHIINPKNITATNLFYRAHSAFRAACGAAMAGQVFESAVLGRACLEGAAYALRIHNHPKLAAVWWDRNQSAETKKAAISAFRHSDLRQAITDHDAGLATVFDTLYERTIDFGGHPNQYGIAGSMQLQDSPDQVSMTTLYLHGDGIQMDGALKTIAQIGVCALRMMQFTMPEKFMLLGVRDAIQEVGQGL